VVTRTCWLVCVAALLWLGAQRRLPFRLREFLDDAYWRGLLRVVGPVYQFGYAVLQGHLVSPIESLQSASDCRPPTESTTSSAVIIYEVYWPG